MQRLAPPLQRLALTRTTPEMTFDNTLQRLLAIAVVIGRPRESRIRNSLLSSSKSTSTRSSPVRIAKRIRHDFETNDLELQVSGSGSSSAIPFLYTMHWSKPNFRPESCKSHTLAARSPL